VFVLRTRNLYFEIDTSPKHVAFVLATIHEDTTSECAREGIGRAEANTYTLVHVFELLLA
jgi:hypothetical protein